jgi:aryl-phospho-beta-D-glucosidase BglC (GH1 family)
MSLSMLSVATLVLFRPVVTSGAAPLNGIEVSKQMGFGFNLGNCFDLGINPTALTDVRKVIDLYAGAGAKHVRIPVTWMDGFDGKHLADASGNINVQASRFMDLKAAVRYALSKNLYVVINAHHEHWLKRSYSGDKHDSIFANLWKGIATQFSSESPKLIFEVLNEPEDVFGSWGGYVKPYDAAALTKTRHINEVGYKAIRATGGKNATRIVMFGMNGQGNHSMLAAMYPTRDGLPGAGKDANIIATLHTYDPWPFCGQDGKLSEYPGADAVVKSLRGVLAHAKKLGIGVNYGEYGVGRKEQQSDRDSGVVREYYRVVTKTVLESGASATPWDDRGWFGLIEPKDAGYRFKYGLVPEMIP